MTVLDLALRTVVHRIRFSHGVRHHCIVTNTHDGLLYVTTELDQSVSIIDPHTFTIVGSIPTGQAQSHLLALSPDGHFAYTANIAAGSVSVLNLRSRKLIAVIPVAKTLQRISVPADGRYVFTAGQAALRCIAEHIGDLGAHRTAVNCKLKPNGGAVRQKPEEARTVFRMPSPEGSARAGDKD